MHSGQNKHKKPPESLFKFTHFLSRLTVWFGIISILFRCPNSPEDLGSHSPRICKPYFQVKQNVSPHLQPYYEAYAAPYVDRLRPYTDVLYEKVYVPSHGFTVSSYEAYAAPRIAQAQVYGQQQWDQVLRPQLDQLQGKIVVIYQSSLSPHVHKVYDVVDPYVEYTRNTAGQQYDTLIVPTYEKARPYAVSIYEKGSRFTIDIAFPYSRWAANNAVLFVQRQVWPPIRILYGENVQPQLLKIKERLANYRDSKKLEAAADSVQSQIIEATTRAAPSIASSVGPSSTILPKDVTETEYLRSSSEKISTSVQSFSTQAPENILDDLKIWKAKFTKAAAEGADGLRERVTEICNLQVTEQAHGTGEALVTTLEETAKSAIANLKKDIMTIVGDLPSDDEELGPNNEESAKEKTITAVRTAGKRIKDTGQKLRFWRRSYDNDTLQLITSAGDATLDVVDSIREAGLQEIGMRWASMEGVTYKDWSEYHALRKSFDEWRGTLQSVVSEHEGLKHARKAGEEVESRGMAVAEDAATELVRLKDVAGWKVDARDASDDFSTRYTPPGAARAAQKVANAASNAMSKSTRGTAESLTSRVGEAAESVVDQVESATEEIKSPVSSFISPVTEGIEDASSSVSSAISSAASGVKSNVSPLPPSASRATSSLSSAASDEAASASSKSASISSRGSYLSSRASVSRSSATSIAGITRESGVPANIPYGQSIIAADNERIKKSSEAEVQRRIAEEDDDEQQEDADGNEEEDAFPASGTTVPGSDISRTDTISLAASASASIASVVNAAGEGYPGVTKSVDRVEKLRKGVREADGRGRESPVESMRSVASEA